MIKSDETKIENQHRMEAEPINKTIGIQGDF